ncbi:MAG: hypothetical protein L0177_13870, partial [Chloroflexi bacterium]|nr:hypothetical protein [Chloroflexota bacterium]
TLITVSLTTVNKCVVGTQYGVQPSPIIKVSQDEDDEEVFIYRRWYTGIYRGDKWVVVVVVIHPDDAFISTAYVTSEL